jgi:hypothetical protein
MLWVCICSIKPKIYFDPTCVLSSWDHDFIEQDSYVAYNFLGQIKQSHLVKMLQLRYYSSKADCRPDTLERVLDGIERTDQAPRGLVAEFVRIRTLQKPDS